MKYIVNINDSHNSIACLLYMLERVPKENIIPISYNDIIICDYLDYLEAELNIYIIRLENEEMEDLCKRKKFVINTQMKNYTFKTRMELFEKYLKKHFVDKSIEYMVVEGIRREESQSRANTEVFNIKKSIIKGKKFYKPTLYPIAYWNTDEVFSYIESKGVLNSL